MLKNTTSGYGWLSILLHWLNAIVIFGLFGLGLFMVELDYYDDWYHKSTHWHESIGMLFFMVLVFRFVWRQINIKPEPLSNSPLQRRIAKLAHLALYVLMFLIPISGYLITTADGHDIAVFDWFKIPSITGNIDNLETLSGTIHYWLSVAIIALSVGHLGAAFKHHFIDKDNTLKRMLRNNK